MSKLISLLLLASLQFGLAATYKDAPYLGSVTPLLQTTFCKVNRCQQLSKTAMGDHTEEAYNIWLPKDKNPHTLMVLKASGKVVRMSLRAFGQDYFPDRTHVEMVLFATGTTEKMTVDRLQRISDGGEKGFFKGYLGRSYSISLESMIVTDYRDIWFTVVEYPY